MKKKEKYTGGKDVVIFGEDIPGNPIRGKKSADECKAACSSTPGCTAYTWVGPNAPFPELHNTCWAKSKFGSQTIPLPDSFSENMNTQQVQKTGIPVQTGIPVLDYHNAVREKHGANPLVWNPAIAANAQGWANKCYHRHGSDTGTTYGQNLAWGHADEVAAATDWYNEYKVIQASGYDISKGGHFAQMVWKEAKEMGCGKAMCDGRSYIVCEYNPPNIAWPQDYPKHVQVDPSP